MCASANAEPTTIARPDPHRYSAYGSTSTTASVTSPCSCPSHSAVAPESTVTAASAAAGATRRDGSTAAASTATASAHQRSTRAVR